MDHKYRPLVENIQARTYKPITLSVETFASF